MNLVHNLLIALLLVFLIGYVDSSKNELNSVWRWECIDNHCQKRAIDAGNVSTALSLAACQLFCLEKGALWPQPTGQVTIGNYLAKINVNSIDILSVPPLSETRIGPLVRNAFNVFRKRIQDLVQSGSSAASRGGGKSLIVNLMIADRIKNKLNLINDDESYNLTISETSDGRINVTIVSSTYFGARHALETVNQLIIYDDLRDEVQIARDVHVDDRPAYTYRGILLDTSRNYVDLATIKRTLDAMGQSKLNVFHWHITDSHSFPYVSKSYPDLSKYGAYTPRKIYTPENVADIVQYGLVRGVVVLPEFDAPAHVGEGWQNTGLVTCFNKQPWQDYCVEPPCGQFDPTQKQLYDVLEGIYGDMIDQFQPDVFHMGGDEVHFGCWNSTPSIVEWMETEQGWGRTELDFVKLWDYFQSEALARLYKKAGREIPVIMWTSTLTHPEYLIDYLPKDKYIIQIWTTGTDEQVKNLLNNDYRVILSNYDALYFDCGFAGWVNDGNNWCSPYIGWQKVYENKPEVIAGAKKNLVLGGEAALWTEQADSQSIDGRLWPRGAALAEVLWTEPTSTWREAEQRILIHRERLVDAGVQADALAPEWCRQYEGSCPLNGAFNKP